MPPSNGELVVFVAVMTSLIMCLTTLVVTLTHIFQRKMIRSQQSIDGMKQSHERELINTKLEIQEQTFQEVSKDIHDNIGLSLTLSKLNLTTLQASPVPIPTSELEISVELLTKAIEGLRDLSKSLNSDAVAANGLLAMVQAEVSKVSRVVSSPIDFVLLGESRFLHSTKEVILFRVLQESIQNILKHANANNISITLNYLDESLELTVVDDGLGYDSTEINAKTTSLKSSGLGNMESRIHLLGGSTCISSARGKGTRVHVSVPY